MKWPCASCRPGITARPPASMTRVFAPFIASAPALSPTNDDPAAADGQGLGLRAGGVHGVDDGVVDDDVGVGRLGGGASATGVWLQPMLPAARSKPTRKTRGERVIDDGVYFRNPCEQSI